MYISSVSWNFPKPPTSAQEQQNHHPKDEEKKLEGAHTALNNEFTVGWHK